MATAVVFGEPNHTAIDEIHPYAPIYPYGRSELMVEHVLQGYAGACGLALVTAAVRMASTLLGLLVLYLLKAALGIDLLPGQSLGVWT